MKKTLSEHILFFKKSIHNLKQFGALFPCSKNVTRNVAKQITDKDGWVVELGPGLGNSTEDIIDIGVLPEKLVLVEIDQGCSELLRKKFPKTIVLNIDAIKLSEYLPEETKDRVKTIVSSIPFFNFKKEIREEIFKECFKILGKNGKMIVFSYVPIPPIKTEKFGISKRRVTIFPIFNIPPVYIWEYSSKKSSY